MMILITFLPHFKVKHAAKKKKWTRGSNKSCVNKVLRNAIMKRSRLKKETNKTSKPIDIRNYSKQRYHVVNLSKEAKLEYLVNVTLPTTTHFG